MIQADTEMRPQVEAGRLRFLDSAAEALLPVYPDFKTLSEMG